MLINKIKQGFSNFQNKIKQGFKGVNINPKKLIVAGAILSAIGAAPNNAMAFDGAALVNGISNIINSTQKMDNSMGIISTQPDKFEEISINIENVYVKKENKKVKILNIKDKNKLNSYLKQIEIKQLTKEVINITVEKLKDKYPEISEVLLKKFAEMYIVSNIDYSSLDQGNGVYFKNGSNLKYKLSTLNTNVKQSFFEKMMNEHHIETSLNLTKLNKYIDGIEKIHKKDLEMLVKVEKEFKNEFIKNLKEEVKLSEQAKKDIAKYDSGVILPVSYAIGADKIAENLILESVEKLENNPFLNGVYEQALNKASEEILITSNILSTKKIKNEKKLSNYIKNNVNINSDTINGLYNEIQKLENSKGEMVAAQNMLMM